MLEEGKRLALLFYVHDELFMIDWGNVSLQYHFARNQQNRPEVIDKNKNNNLYNINTLFGPSKPELYRAIFIQALALKSISENKNTNNWLKNEKRKMLCYI